MQYLLQKMNEALCFILGHNYEARLRLLEGGAVEGYYKCTRCNEEGDDES